MKIVSLQLKNIKRVVAVEIRPDGNLVEITGKNGNGKTSILDAIYFTLAGNKVIQPKPVRDGAESGYCTLDLGDYKITRKFKVKADGDYTTSLTVENKDGFKAGSPQEVLNGFLGDLTFDPLAFSRMKPKDQVVALRALVPDYDFDAANKANDVDFSARTEINRTIRDLKARIEAIVLPEGTPEERVSLDDLMSELKAALEHNSSVDASEAECRRAEERIESNNEGIRSRLSQIAEMKRRIAELENLNASAETIIAEHRKVIDAHAGVESKIDIEPIQARIAQSEVTNRNVAQRDQLVALKEEMKAAEIESANLTKAIEERKAAAASAVREAKLPVAGLDITEDAILLNGQPFEQASDAEKLRVSVAVAGAMNPTLKIVRVRDGSLLDGDSMAALEKYAEENDLQVWIETVESGRAGAVIIEDGMVASYREAAE